MKARTKWIGVGLATGALVASVATMAGASASDTQSATPPAVTVANGGASFPSANTETSVVSMPLTHGKYLLTAVGNVFAHGWSNWTCEISVGSKAIATTVDSNTTGDSDWTAALTGVAKVGRAGATATLQCEVG
jgi:hypothetical protein